VKGSLIHFRVPGKFNLGGRLIFTGIQIGNEATSHHLHQPGLLSMPGIIFCSWFYFRHPPW